MQGTDCFFTTDNVNECQTQIQSQSRPAEKKQQLTDAFPFCVTYSAFAWTKYSASSLAITEKKLGLNLCIVSIADKIVSQAVMTPLQQTDLCQKCILAI